MKNGGYIIRLRLVVFEIFAILWTYSHFRFGPEPACQKTRAIRRMRDFLFRFLSAILDCRASSRLLYTNLL